MVLINYNLFGSYASQELSEISIHLVLVLDFADTNSNHFVYIKKVKSF